MTKTEGQERRTLKLWPDVGQALGVGRHAIYEAARRNELPGVIRIGRRLVMTRAALERLLSETEHSHAP